VFESRVLRRNILGPKEEKVRENCRQLHKENLFKYDPSPHTTGRNKSK
jgi:hypothetical protein